MTGRRRQAVGERVFAVVLLLGGVGIACYRWTLPGEATWSEYVLRGVCVLFGLVCAVGAYDLWRMGAWR